MCVVKQGVPAVARNLSLVIAQNTVGRINKMENEPVHPNLKRRTQELIDWHFSIFLGIRSIVCAPAGIAVALSYILSSPFASHGPRKCAQPIGVHLSHSPRSEII